MISQDQFKQTAALIGCDTAAIKAVYAVETNGQGYLPDGRVKILFEGHRFWRSLSKAGIQKSALLHVANNPKYKNVLYEDWTSKYYKGGAAEWLRMSQALEVCKLMNVNDDIALQSASYGSFQILGENCRMCGYATAHEMVTAFNQGGESEQLNAFIRFVKAKHLDDELIAHNWVSFASGYNGSQFRKNQYHIKLAFEYKKAKTLEMKLAA